jgi:hypothetical protein
MGKTASATLFLTTPLPPRILTPAAKLHKKHIEYTGTLTTACTWNALRSAHTTTGNSVYPMIETL